MDKFISTPTISEILKEEFMEPLGLSAYRLAKDIHVPGLTSPRNSEWHTVYFCRYILCVWQNYFGVSEGYFLRLQMDVDLRTAKLSAGMEEALASIKHCEALEPVDCQ